MAREIWTEFVDKYGEDNKEEKRNRISFVIGQGLLRKAVAIRGLQFHKAKYEMSMGRPCSGSCGGSRDDSRERKGQKGGRRMPWLPQAMKDAESCEKARGPAYGG